MNRSIFKIILHCTATPEGRKTSVEEIVKWHKARGFRTIGYHYVIHLDGTISQGREENEIGAHCKGENSYSIGISYVGGVDKKGKPKDTRTPEQMHAMRILVDQMRGKYPKATVHGHNEFANKACPCFDVAEWIRQIAL